MKPKKIILVSDAVFNQCLKDIKSWLDDEDYVVLNEKEVNYLRELVCQQNDKYEVVHNITKKLGGYDI